jgi:hypothetical protein
VALQNSDMGSVSRTFQALFRAFAVFTGRTLSLKISLSITQGGCSKCKWVGWEGRSG